MSDNDAGLSIIYKGGYVSDLAICIDPTDRFYGWLLARNPLDGQWVSLAKMDANATNLHEAREKIATLERELEEARAGVAWRYIDGPEDGADPRCLVTLEEDRMRWVGVRAWNANTRQWLNGGEPERARVIAWQPLPVPAIGYWQHGKLVNERRT